LIDLVALAVMAKTGEEEMPLLPARYHTFARALEGAFICLNEKDHPRMANCTRCGTAYIVGTDKLGSELDEQPQEFGIKLNNRYLLQDSQIYISETVRDTNY